MNLGEFKEQIKAEANKGKTLDSVIPKKIRQAAFFLEANYTLSHMRRFVSFETDSRSFQQPDRIKSIEFLRLVQANGNLKELKRVQPQDVSRRLVARPEGFWLDANEFIWLDNTPSEVLEFEMYYKRYTDWPTEDSASHPLLDFAEQAMVGQTMLLLAPFMRELQLAQGYKQMRDEALNVLTRSQDELDFNGADMKMRYDPLQ